MYGSIATLAYVLLSAVFNIWGYVLLQNWPLPLVLIGAFLPTITVILMWSKFFKKSKVRSLHIMLHNKEMLINLFWLNIMTMFCWVATFIALSNMLPSSFSAFSYGLVPLLTLPVNYYIRGRKITFEDFFASFFIFLGLLLIGKFEMERRFLEGIDDFIIGAISSFIVAVSATASIVYARKLNDLGVTSRTVFNHRFWGVLVASVVWLCAFGATVPENALTELPNVIGIGIIGIAIPLLCSQYAISKKGAFFVSCFLGSVPVTVLVMQYFTGLYTDLNTSILVGTALVFIGVTLISTSMSEKVKEYTNYIKEALKKI